MLLNRNMRAVLIRHYLHFQTVYTIYGTVTVWYGQQPYNTVKMKIRYGSGTVRETGRPYKLAWPPVLRCLPQVAYSLNFLYSWCIVWYLPDNDAPGSNCNYSEQVTVTTCSLVVIYLSVLCHLACWAACDSLITLITSLIRWFWYQSALEGA
jgi:hypothetical protein